MDDNGVSVPVLVERGIGRCRDRQDRLHSTMKTADRAQYLRRIAETFRQEARWFGVLTDWLCTWEARTLPRVLVSASVAAGAHAESFAFDYQHLADDQVERDARRGLGRAA
jgi:hypothetical protein